MKSVLAGIAVAWAIIGAIAGTIWIFDNHPETAKWLAFAVFVTLGGAFMGWAGTS